MNSARLRLYPPRFRKAIALLALIILVPGLAACRDSSAGADLSQDLDLPTPTATPEVRATIAAAVEATIEAIPTPTPIPSPVPTATPVPTPVPRFTPTPLPTPTPTPIPGPLEWQTVTTLGNSWIGDGTTQTELFRVASEEWRITWNAVVPKGGLTMDDLQSGTDLNELAGSPQTNVRYRLNITVMNRSGNRVGVVAQHTGWGADTSYMRTSPGEYYLVIDYSNLLWTLTVEDQR